MLVYFKIGNFKCVKDPIVINFNAASISEHNDSNVINEGGYDLIRSILLYGHNASGKSKILEALEYFRSWTIHSVQTNTIEIYEPEFFALDDVSENKPSLFEACFVLNNVKYRYGFTVDKVRVHEEWLLESKSPAAKDFPIFLRSNEEFQIDYKRFENAEGLQAKTRKDALFLSVASQWNVEKAIRIIEWIRKIQLIHGVEQKPYPQRTITFLQNDKYASLIKDLINKADLGISDIGLTEFALGVQNTLFGDFAPEIEPESKRQDIYTVHTKFNSENIPVGSVKFLLNKQESEGTIKYFNIIGQLLYAIKNGSLIVIDEFDARLHTLLSKAIIKLFNSSQSKSHAQLLVASHDTALLDKRILRRDQIYFVSKNPFGASEVTALVEYKARKETPYDKNYLDGKYGAIPFIEEFESLIKDAE